MSDNNNYHIKTLLMPNGERLPILLRPSGLPVYDVVIYVMAEVRGTNKASKTILHVLSAIQLLYIFMESRGIVLERRLEQGELLSLPEIQTLIHYCKLPLSYIKQSLPQDNFNLQGKVTFIEKVRQTISADTFPSVSSSVVATRMIYIRNYLVSLSKGWAYKHEHGSREREMLVIASEELGRMLDSRLPSTNHHKEHLEREGLEQNVIEQLVAVIDPHSPRNPWRSMHCKVRNELLILWLYYFGIRRGELLAVYVSDISFFGKTVAIERRADNPKDPRVNQPLVKTRARILPISDGLLGKTEEYIKLSRSLFKEARKHTFLFVADGGAPLSLEACNKIFAVLRAKCPELPHNLFPHIFRHTWNERFSEIADRKHFSEADETKMRAHLMGWSETSGTATTYTRRHTRKKASEVFLEMQKRLQSPSGESNE